MTSKDTSEIKSSGVMELVKVFAIIASQLQALMVFKMKQKRYNEALLFLYKNQDKTPSFSSTQFLGTKDWYYAESNLLNYDHLQTEKDWISYFKQVYHYGSPVDITRCALT